MIRLIKDQYFLLSMLALICVIMVFTGCAKSQLVLIPQKCEIKTTSRPIPTGLLVTDVANILKYTEILENDLDACTGNLGYK